MTPRGSEHSQNTCEKQAFSESGGAESGAPRADSPSPTTPPTPPADPDLARVIAAWADLPPAIRAGVVALVDAAKPDKPA